MLVRSMQLLLDPDPITGGGPPPTPAPVPVPPATTTAPPAPVPAPIVTQDELSRLRAAESEATRLRDAETQRLATARQAEIDAAAKKGQWDTVLALKDADLKAAQQRIVETEARTQRFALDSALATGLSGYPFRDPAWGPTIISNLRGQFRVYPVGETYEVRHTTTGQTVGDFLRVEMAKPMYQGVLAPATSGGAPALDAYGRPTGQAIPDTPFGRDMSNFLERKKQEQQAGGGSFGFN